MKIEGSKPGNSYSSIWNFLTKQKKCFSVCEIFLLSVYYFGSSQRQSQVGWPAVLLHGGAPKTCRNCLSSQRKSQVGWPSVLLHGGDPRAYRNCLSILWCHPAGSVDLPFVFWIYLDDPRVEGGHGGAVVVDVQDSALAGLWTLSEFDELRRCGVDLFVSVCELLDFGEYAGQLRQAVVGIWAGRILEEFVQLLL